MPSPQAGPPQAFRDCREKGIRKLISQYPKHCYEAPPLITTRPTIIHLILLTTQKEGHQYSWSKDKKSKAQRGKSISP